MTSVEASGRAGSIRHNFVPPRIGRGVVAPVALALLRVVQIVDAFA